MHKHISFNTNGVGTFQWIFHLCGGVCVLPLSPHRNVSAFGFNYPGDATWSPSAPCCHQATNGAFTALRVDGSCVAWGNPQSGGALGQELFEVHGIGEF